MEIYKEFGAKTRQLRLSMGLSQETLAFKAGISTGFLSHIERGGKKASLQTVGRLAQALGVPIGHLFTPVNGRESGKQKDDAALLIRRLRTLLRDRDGEYRRVLWKVAKYLADYKTPPRR
mgnify:CR=1 FL=1